MQNIGDNLHIDPLMSCLIMQSYTQRESYDLIQKNVNHTFHIEWKKGQTNTQCHAIKVGRISLLSLQFGNEVEIFPQIESSRNEHVHLTAFFALRGGFETMIDGVTLLGKAADMHLCSPLKKASLHWQERAQVLLLRVPAQLAYESMTNSKANSLGNKLTLVPGQALLGRNNLAILNMINMLLFAQERQGFDLPFQAEWISHIEQTCTLLLLQYMTSSNTRSQQVTEYRKKTTASPLYQLEDYLLRHHTAPITIDDMLKISGLSRSHLHKACRKYLGLSPMVWLRNIRLDAAYQQLKAFPSKSVTEVALNFGFGHVGRFSNYFYQRFHLYPAELKQQALE